jgi:hypothetical protein
MVGICEQVLLEGFFDTFALNLTLKEKQEVGILRLLAEVVLEVVLVFHGLDNFFIHRKSWSLVCRFTIVRFLNICWTGAQSIYGQYDMVNMI